MSKVPLFNEESGTFRWSKRHFAVLKAALRKSQGGRLLTATRIIKAETGTYLMQGSPCFLFSFEREED